MSDGKVLLSNLVELKKNIKQKIMGMKRGNIDSDHYFRETFKPILDPLNTIAENNYNDNNSKNNLSDASDLEDNNDFSTTSQRFSSFDKTYGLYYSSSDDEF